VRRQRLPVLGWKEQVALPDWGVPRLRAKLDTGARSSALHVVDITEVGTTELDGVEVPLLSFGVLSGPRGRPTRHDITAPALERKSVRDTGGKEEDRPVVRTRIVCGPVDVVADVTLTSRDLMNFRMLLGRLTLQGACLVDPALGYLHTPEPPPRTRGAPAAAPPA
jgi:hypothetical protein